MKDDVIEKKLDWLQRCIDRVERKIEPEIKISENVQHSIIWAISLIVVAIIICITIVKT